MSTPTPTRTSTLSPPSAGPLGRARSEGAGGADLLRGLGQILGSQAGLAVAGLISLPILARNLQPAGYGGFSLFMLALGSLSYFDFARPILIRELAGAAGEPAASRRLLRANALVLGAGALVAGGLLLDMAATAGLTLALLLHASASGPFARLNADGRAGLALSVRNGCWAGATLAVVPLSFATASSHAYVWAFALGNLGILLGYRRLVAGRAAGSGAEEASPAEAGSHGAQIRNLLGFSAASTVLVGADRAILRHNSAAGDFGQYGAQYDLAVKINLVSTALGSLLYPMLARVASEGDEEATGRIFVRYASRIAVAYFAVLLLVIAFHQPILALILGADFAGGARVYALLCAGAFLHLFGFLITPFQRARGDFATHRRCYNLSAVIMVIVGVLLIPRFGAWGAVATYLCARLAEVLLIAHEVQALPRRVLPRWRVAVLALMVLALFGAARWSLMG